MDSALQQLFEATVAATAPKPPGVRIVFVEEHADYFVLCVESETSSLRLTHFLDEPSRLSAVYGELRDRLQTEDAARQALLLSLGSGPLRLGLGKDEEPCWRADYDPGWPPPAPEAFASGIVRSAAELVRTIPFTPAPGSDVPLAVHAADELATDRNPLPGASPGEIEDWLASSSVDLQPTEGSTWSIVLPGAQRVYRCWVRLGLDGFLLGFNSARPVAACLPLLRDALLRNYHLRFFKLGLDAGGHGIFALEWPRAITEEQLRYFARRFPVYLDHVLAELPGFLEPG